MVSTSSKRRSAFSRASFTTFLVSDLIEGKEIPETMAKSEGKKVVNEAREKAERLLEDVETMMSQIKAKA